ncbi:MBL fold metallo-hydrolase [Streptomyces sp. NPDC056222]|uniref:MBL fold metallo-hydrolase n=1 Tax=Streptomyces sp. NPDC056222 TaxID=3345749 RepID=UPI0035DEC778
MDFIEITPRLHMLHFSIGQAYLWRDDEELTLIDAGWAGSAPEIEAAMRGAGLGPSALRRIVLTHCHRDHVGSAQELADRFGAEIVAHRLDADVIRGEAPVPEPVLLDWEIPLYERGLTVPAAPATRVDREVEDGDALGFGDGAVVVHTPGHTPGSLAVHLPEHGVLFTGDTVATVQGVTFGVFHVDRERAMDSMRRLAELKPSVLCCGHGDPVTTDTARRLAEAAA